MGRLSIHKLENALFNEWPEHDNVLFCWDGLHYTGIASKDKGYWTMVPNNKEEELWFNSPIRCLFLTKDHNLKGDEEGVDFREETGLDNDTDSVYYQFYARYLQLLYGLMHIDTTTFDYPTLEVAKDIDSYLYYFHEAPVVRINTKKIAGGSNCPASVLAPFLNRDCEYIKKQVSLYDANIIVVCQADYWDINSKHDDIWLILDLVYQQYPDMKRWRDDNDCLYYSAKSKTVILHEWHPGARVSYADYYQGVKHVAEFLKEHPDYLRSKI